MSNNAQRVPFGRSINQNAMQRANDALQALGRALPCSVVSVDGAIVTVRFEVSSVFTLPHVAVPLFGPEWIRYPIQPGEKGVVFAADARLGAMSGLGGGVADLAAPANLGALVFFPIGNATWGSVDPQSVTIYGPNGVVLRDTGSDSVITLTPSGVSIIARDSFTIVTGAATITMDASGAYSIVGTVGVVSAPSLTFTDGVASTSPTIMHNAWAALVSWLNTHDHSNGDGGSPTGVPIVPFTGTSIAP
jgi:hypothetical protein